jgi:hypothetical protein
MIPELKKMIEEELVGHAGVSFDFEKRKKHDRIIFFFDHQSRFITASKSPSDHRAIKNIRSDVRRVLKEFENG